MPRPKDVSKESEKCDVDALRIHQLMRPEPTLQQPIIRDAWLLSDGPFPPGTVFELDFELLRAWSIARLDSLGSREKKVSTCAWAVPGPVGTCTWRHGP